MGRKKKYKDGELENEFNLLSFYHKITTIGVVLKRATMYGDYRIYNKTLLKKKYKQALAEGLTSYEEIADRVVKLFVDEHDNDIDENLNKIYNWCWEEIVQLYDEHMNYTEGLTVKDLF